MAKNNNINVRRFDAATYQRTIADWIQDTILNFDDELRTDMRTLRARSRDASINDPYARRFFKALRTQVVGPNGIQLRMGVRNSSGNPDALANVLIEERWEKFSKNVTTDGLNLRCALNLFLETMARDGEVFAILRKGSDFGPHMLQVQFFEAEYVDIDYNATLSNGNEIRSGIEYDNMNRRVAYHFFKQHPNSNRATTRERVRITAENVIHGFDKERVAQGRGYPWLSAALINLTHLKEYQRSELIASRVASAKMGFFTRPRGENELGDEEDASDANALIQEAEPGIFDILPEGYGLQTFDPQNPNGNFADFTKAILRSIASSQGVSYHLLSNDLESTSYSSLRQGELDQRETFKELQQLTIDTFLTPLFEAWLTNMLSFRLDNIRLPLELYDKFNAPIWRPRTWAWIDPHKETAAIKMQLDERLRSRTDVARQLGMDYTDVLAEIAEEEAKAAELGVDIYNEDKLTKTDILEQNFDKGQNDEE